MYGPKPKLGFWSYCVMAVGAAGWAAVLVFIALETIRFIGPNFDPSLGAVYVTVFAVAIISCSIALLGVIGSVLPILQRGRGKSISSFSLFVVVSLISVGLLLWLSTQL